MNNKIHVPGIPDAEFLRGKIPMTKEEIRVITLAKANISRDSIIWDVGAGTGSLSIEAALLAPGGHVYAVEREEEGCGLIKSNAQRFGAENITVIQAAAPEGLENLPQPDCILVGGSGGQLNNILNLGFNSLKLGGKVVVNAVTLDTLTNAVKILEDLGLETEVTSISVSRLEKLGNSRLFKALNPVFIITATKEDNSVR